VLECNNGLGGFRQNLVNLATRYECLCVSLYVCVYRYVRASVKRFRMFSYVRASGRRVMRVRMCLYVHACVMRALSCSHVCRVHSKRCNMRRYTRHARISSQPHTHTPTHPHKHTHKHKYTHTYTCTHTHTHARTHAHTHAHS